MVVGRAVADRGEVVAIGDRPVAHCIPEAPGHLVAGDLISGHVEGSESRDGGKLSSVDEGHRRGIIDDEGAVGRAFVEGIGDRGDDGVAADRSGGGGGSGIGDGNVEIGRSGRGDDDSRAVVGDLMEFGEGHGCLGLGHVEGAQHRGGRFVVRVASLRGGDRDRAGSGEGEDVAPADRAGTACDGEGHGIAGPAAGRREIDRRGGELVGNRVEGDALCRLHDDERATRAALVDGVADRSDDGIEARLGGHRGGIVVGDDYCPAQGIGNRGRGLGRAIVGLREVAEGDGGGGFRHGEAVGDIHGRLVVGAARLARGDRDAARPDEAQCAIGDPGWSARDGEGDGIAGSTPAGRERDGISGGLVRNRVEGDALCRLHDDERATRAALVDGVADRSDDGIEARLGGHRGGIVVGDDYCPAQGIGNRGRGLGRAIVVLREVAEGDGGGGFRHGERLRHLECGMMEFVARLIGAHGDRSSAGESQHVPRTQRRRALDGEDDGVSGASAGCRQFHGLGRISGTGIGKSDRLRGLVARYHYRIGLVGHPVFRVHLDLEQVGSHDERLHGAGGPARNADAGSPVDPNDEVRTGLGRGRRHGDRVRRIRHLDRIVGGSGRERGAQGSAVE